MIWKAIKLANCIPCFSLNTRIRSIFRVLGKVIQRMVSPVIVLLGQQETNMALIAYILFLLIAVIGRVILQYRITGDHGLRSINEKSSNVTKLSSILFVVTFLSSFSLSILDALTNFEPQLNLGVLATMIGGLFCSIGIIITTISQYQMGAAWRIGVDENEQTDLIIHGLYSYVRNPIYTGVILFGLGLLVLIPHAYMLFSLLVGYLSIELHVRYTEEPYLKQLHGSNYQKYAKNINRYFPKMVVYKYVLTKNLRGL